MTTITSVEHLRALLIEARKQSGLSQRAAGRKAGIDPVGVYRLEAGELMFGISRLVRYTQTLGLELVLAAREKSDE